MNGYFNDFRKNCLKYVTRSLKWVNTHQSDAPS
jgi:hypothetical protein